jgi:histidinol-phosphatase
VSGIAAIEDAQVVYASTLELQSYGRAPGWRTLLERAWRERGFGDFWGYTLVAEAAADVMVESDLSPWDAAAPLVLVEEAGGRATDFEGIRSVYNRTFLATNGRLHDEVLGILSGRTEDPTR